MYILNSLFNTGYFYVLFSSFKIFKNIGFFKMTKG